ncbi:hypothetical protein BROUX41_005830 [Berkeleyomyces rouxiae]|uniref:uncharacterized protein n=1 Tax=Berkeleyomyces rouxiae TaxID=2035830 RepID=UPI003B7CAF63
MGYTYSPFLFSPDSTARSHTLTAQHLKSFAQSLNFDDTPSTQSSSRQLRNNMLVSPRRRLSSHSDFEEGDSASDTLFLTPFAGTSIPDDLLPVDFDWPQETDMEPFPSYDDSGFVFPDPSENDAVCTAACCKYSNTADIGFDMSPVAEPDTSPEQESPAGLSRQITAPDVTLSKYYPNSAMDSTKLTRAVRSNRIMLLPQRRSPKRSKIPSTWMDAPAPALPFSPKKVYDPTPYRSPGERRKKARKRMKDRSNLLEVRRGEPECKLGASPVTRYTAKAAREARCTAVVTEPERVPLLSHEEAKKWEPSTTGLLFGVVAMVFLCFWVVDMIYNC